MPLIKSASKEARRKNIAELMDDMFFMFKRMAIRAKNYKIVQIIVFSISINVVYAKNIFNFIITTFLTYINHTATDHHSSDSCKMRIKCRPSFFIKTHYGTVNSFLIRTTSEFFIAVFAFCYNASSTTTRFIIAFPRTVFSFFCSCAYNLKFFITDFARKLISNRLRISRTFAGTIFSRAISIVRNIELFRTFDTINKFSSARGHYAII